MKAVQILKNYSKEDEYIHLDEQLVVKCYLHYP